MQRGAIIAIKVTGGCVAVILAGFFLLALAGSIFPESNFQLAPESRLPKYFTVPRTLTRSEVKVRLDYYILPWGRRATFTLLGPTDEVLSKVTGSLQGYEPKRPTTQGAINTRGYPMYEVVSLGGITEVIEHRKMEPVFYLSDDPAIRAELISNKAMRP